MNVVNWGFSVMKLFNSIRLQVREQRIFCNGLGQRSFQTDRKLKNLQIQTCRQLVLSDLDMPNLKDLAYLDQLRSACFGSGSGQRIFSSGLG